MPQNITEKDIKRMIRRHNAGLATAKEKAFIDAYYSYLDKGTPASDDELGREMKAYIMAHVRSNSGGTKVFSLRPVYRYAVAACLLLAVSIAGYFIFRPAPPRTQEIALALKNDVAPGGNQAILTLSNGQKIVLDNQHGHIASQGSTSIALNATGQVNYKGTTGNRGEVLYNTLTVLMGNHRDITLSDGTEVSLDAGSSLTYPVAFSGSERIVTLTGQGYFKVKHNQLQPFLVKASGIAVRDIGTEFNINAYNDEPPVRTTLFEGSVKVNNVLLKPGQQASANGAGVYDVQNADLETIGAWRHNDFIFRNQDLHTIMRQIARWYNVDIVYDHAPEQLHIRAEISRDHNLSVILKAIQETGRVKFKVEGRTVTVSE